MEKLIQTIDDKSDLSTCPIFLNPDKHDIRGFSRHMITRYLVVVTAMTAMLVAATALATTDSAFAGKKGKEYSQATAQVNDCGNDFQPTDVFCQNLNSQIQGEENSAALTGEQGGEEAP